MKPAAKGAITIDTFDGVAWKATPLKTTSAASGAWRITTVATAIKAEGQYRAQVIVGKKKTISKIAMLLHTPENKHMMQEVMMNQKLQNAKVAHRVQ